MASIAENNCTTLFAHCLSHVFHYHARLAEVRYTCPFGTKFISSQFHYFYVRDNSKESIDILTIVLTIGVVCRDILTAQNWGRKEITRLFRILQTDLLLWGIASRPLCSKPNTALTNLILRWIVYKMLSRRINTQRGRVDKSSLSQVPENKSVCD